MLADDEVREPADWSSIAHIVGALEERLLGRPPRAPEALQAGPADLRAALGNLTIDELYASDTLLTRDEIAWRSAVADRLIAGGYARLDAVPDSRLADVLYRETRTPLELELLDVELATVVDTFGAMTADELRALDAGAELVAEAQRWAARLDAAGYQSLGEVPAHEREQFVT